MRERCVGVCFSIDLESLEQGHVDLMPTNTSILDQLVNHSRHLVPVHCPSLEVNYIQVKKHFKILHGYIC